MIREPNYRSIFEIDNARNETPDTLGRAFVWTSNFERIATPKNHIILGSRGSGKTALVKMISHSYLSRSVDERAVRLIASKKLIGTYVPMRIEWIGGLKNKTWLSNDEQLELFEWRLNLAACIAFIGTMRSCLNTYVQDRKERLAKEISLSEDVSQFLCEIKLSTLSSIEEHLEATELRKQTDIFSKGVEGGKILPDIGGIFHTPLFTPLKNMISALKRHINFPATAAWIIALDEAEFLSPEQQKVLNSHLRSDSSQTYYKITTMPYCHYTMETSSQAPVVHKEDFDYVYIDSAFSKYDLKSFHETGKFIESLVIRRMQGQIDKYPSVSLSTLLGSSDVLGETSDGTTQFRLSDEKTLNLIERYCNESTVNRAREKFGTKGFDDQIKRKLSGALLLIDTMRSIKGNSRVEVYSGREMFVRCSDGNPRRALNLLNNMLLEYPRAISETGFNPVPRRTQNLVYERHSKVYLNRLKHFVHDQISVYDIINVIGNHFHVKLHVEPMGTDLFGSIEVFERDSAVWRHIVEAVGLGALYPIVNSSQPDELPINSGKFRLSYAFSAHFKLLPRKGRAIPLEAIMRDRYARSMLARSAQAGLFDAT